MGQILADPVSGCTQRDTREGITINDSVDDDNLIVMYAAYLFRKRAEDTATMPRMLRYALNNRVISEKGAVDES